jgi:hypothetical protein
MKLMIYQRVTNLVTLVKKKKSKCRRKWMKSLRSKSLIEQWKLKMPKMLMISSIVKYLINKGLLIGRIIIKRKSIQLRW